MAVVTMTVCDECKDSSKVAVRYTVECGGRRAGMDLCPEDARVLEEYIERFSTSKRKARKPRASYDALLGDVVDIEAAKA